MARIQLVVRHEPSTDRVEVLYAGVSPDKASEAFLAAKPGPAVADTSWFDNAVPRRRFRHAAEAPAVAEAPAAKGKAPAAKGKAPAEAPAEADPLA